MQLLIRFGPMIPGENSVKNAGCSMDQSPDLFQVDRSIDLNPLISHEKKKVARRRWAILAKALKSPVGTEPSSPTDECSVRRISSFMLLSTLELPPTPERTWYKYCLQVGERLFSMRIGHCTRTFSAEDLMGFNNTGNVCIWPSEETLSYYICSSLGRFAGKTVLELGGGMSCLAGLFTAKYAQSKAVTITDGNKTSVENAQAALVHNEFQCPIDCKILKWGRDVGAQYDVVLCADCLFFDDARADLVECLFSCLCVGGLGLVMAPRRGTTLDMFIVQSEAKGLSCKIVMNYNAIVWQKRLSLLDNCDYDDDIHYPILIEVTKVKVPLVADYWVSQTRKYCDFCKCWITDNRPSVDFHEKGRRHQENVKKRLRTITKQSNHTQRENDKFDAAVRQMESAAMHAYRKDVENNGDLTSVAINQKLKEDNLTLNESSFSGGSFGKITKLWNEAKTREGKSYYYNIMTNERVWQPPREGYLSVKEQREQAESQAKHQLDALEKFKRKEAINTMREIEQNEAEEKARIAREKMKERRVAEDIAPVTYAPLIEPGKTDPYGRWQTIQESPITDYQLPQQYEYFEAPVELEPEPIIKEFKEKTVQSIDTGDSSFKKRKIGAGAKRNTRQRLDDD